MNNVKNRKRLVKWVRQQLIGPASESSAEKLSGVSPLDRYPVGVLYPLDPTGESADSDEVDDSDIGNGNEKADSKLLDTPSIRRYVPPSSAGFSFYLPNTKWAIQIWFSASIYEVSNPDKRDSEGRFEGAHYKRTKLGGDAEAFTVTESTRKNVIEHPGKDGTCLAGIDVNCRPHGEGVIVTVTLFNKQEMPEVKQANKWRPAQIESSLFEAQLRCIIEHGSVGDYPTVDNSLLDDESQELELQYKSKKVYAVGHGAAAQWKLHDEQVCEIYTDFMPAVEVPQVTADISGGLSAQTLSMGYLADAQGNTESVCASLYAFVDDYEAWVQIQLEKSEKMEGWEQQAAKRITARMTIALDRMKSSIALIQNDENVASAFSLANHAMLDQMLQTSKIKNRAVEAESIRWRPFQLAFLLTSLKSAVDDSDDYRDTVDLIWFPTGGGKTEAYLGLIAAVIVWRRLKFPASCGGTTSFMRYTLRLLTTQQFLRASKMICALELLRRQSTQLGNEPITIGLWVGGDTTPNTYYMAQKIIGDVSEKDLNKSNASFVLESCPWCDSNLSVKESLVVTDDKFYFSCRNERCEFGCEAGSRLPCNVVDEALYENPPTLLMATVDKFARFAWEERASSFFGKENSRPPELIVQDELHLIASALGSIAGVYEAAIETVLVRKGVYPKYVASTATIRMAEDQVRRLYGKNVAVFPPPGLDADDSYYARTVPIETKPGRMYIGYFAPMLNRSRNFAPLSATLLGAPELVFAPGEIDRDIALDAWWTQLVYHGSLKGVSNSQNSFSLGCKDVLERLINEASKEHSQNNKAMTAEERAGAEQHFNSIRKRINPIVTQLTSIPTVEDNARAFANLEKGRGETGCIDSVLATNMVSVGLDVARMALMVINGQPLTTAEYIQASSRVGRSDVPGLVFINYYRDQTRSISHYENFRPYHESFYRFVEPTSLTPFTFQARTRALHAALVIAIRHTIPKYQSSKGAAEFKLDETNVQYVIEQLILRCSKADKGREADIRAHLLSLARDWGEYAEKCKLGKRELRYSVNQKKSDADQLLHAHGDETEGLWVTLHSMRNVENTGLLRLE